MFTAKIDDRLLFTPLKDTYRLHQPKITLEANKASEFSFKVYPDHPEYKNILKFNPIIKAYDDDKLIFRGRVIDDVKGWENEKDISCEGEMSFFNDSIVRPYDFKGSVYDYLQFLVKQHNGQVDKRLQFTVRNVTVVDPNDLIVRANSNYPNTLQEINDKLFGLLGGYFYLEHDEDKNITFLDYYDDPPFKVDQGIEQGKNLLDLTETIKGEDIATAIIPLGAKIESEDGSDTGERLTISSVNNGVDYLYDEKQVQIFGYLYRTVIWDDVTTVEALMRNAKRELSKLIKPTYTLELKAFDLSLIDVSLDKFDVLHYVKATSIYHSLAQEFLITKLTIDMENPENGVVTIGQTFSGISDATNSAQGSIIDTQLTAEDAMNKAIQANKSANSKNTNYYGNKGDGFPTNANVGDIYVEYDGDERTIYMWTGTEWVNTIGTAWQAEFEAEMQEKLDAAKQELDDAIAANNEALVDLDTALTENTKELSDVKDTLAQNQTDLDHLSELTDNATQAGIQAQAAADEAKKESASATAAANNALTQALNGLGLAQIVQNDLNDTKTVIGQLSDSITLAVIKNDVINQINVSTEGVVIAGSRVTITGQTYIENGVIGNAQIADAAIDSAKIRNITADKLVIGQGGNVVANPDFFKDTLNVEPVGWVGGVVKSNALPSPVNPNGKYIRVDSSATANKHAMSQDYIKVVPGEQYSVKAVYFSRYSSVQVGFRGYNEKQEVATSSWIHVQGSATGSSWKQLEGTVTIPEGVQYVRIRVTSLSNATVDFSGFASIDIRRKQDYSLIVDGAILARHLAVDSVTANAIMAGAVTAVQIAANAITAEKIQAGAIVTEHLATNTITADKLAAGAVVMGSATVTGIIDASVLQVINIDAGNIKAGTIDAAQVRIINLDVANLTGNLTNFVKTQWNAGFGDQVAITSNAITMNTSNANLSLTANALRFYSSSYAGASAVFSLGKWRDSSGTQTASTGIYFGSSPSVKSNTNFTNFLNTNGASYMLYAESTMNYGSNTNIVKNALNIFSTTHIWGPTTIHAAAAIYGYLTFYGGDFSRITVDPNKATMNFRIKSGVADGSYFWFNSKIISADGWSSSSLLSMKDVKKEYDGDALGEICKTQLVEYSYKNSPHDKQLSPIIDDVNAVKQYYVPEIITDGKTVNNYAMQSLAWAAIKQLNEKIEKLEKKIA